MKPYIWIFEDGTIMIGRYPNEDDLQAIDDGELQIIDPENLETLDNREWVKLKDVEDQ